MYDGLAQSLDSFWARHNPAREAVANLYAQGPAITPPVRVPIPPQPQVSDPPAHWVTNMLPTYPPWLTASRVLDRRAGLFRTTMDSTVVIDQLRENIQHMRERGLRDFMYHLPRNRWELMRYEGRAFQTGDEFMGMHLTVENLSGMHTKVTITNRNHREVTIIHRNTREDADYF